MKSRRPCCAALRCYWPFSRSRWTSFSDHRYLLGHAVRVVRTVLYSLSQHQALGRRVSHGTIAADLAFGLQPRDVPTDQVPLIGVRLEGNSDGGKSWNR